MAVLVTAQQVKFTSPALRITDEQITCKTPIMLEPMETIFTVSLTEEARYGELAEGMRTFYFIVPPIVERVVPNWCRIAKPTTLQIFGHHLQAPSELQCFFAAPGTDTFYKKPARKVSTFFGYAYAECECPMEMPVRNGTVVEMTLSPDGASSVSPTYITFEDPSPTLLARGVPPLREPYPYPEGLVTNRPVRFAAGSGGGSVIPLFRGGSYRQES